ncbi:MAG: hypothetical protein H0T73_22850 [Ardenticatenales bacterium]|nr:hypothetical protein [Ardenticatenales bacterium]
MKTTYRSLLMLLLLCATLFSLAPIQAAPPAQTGGDWAIPNGHFFTQAASGQGGFSVLDNSEARFWAEFQRLGGLQNVGYPISRRFVYDGFVTQAFQKLVLQWRPEVGQAWPVNIFDELSRHSFDQRLNSTRQTPYPLQNFDPAGATWAQIVANRQGLLTENAAIRTRYFSVRDPLNVFGLPVSRVEDMGNHYAVRTQRAVFQQWKEAVPWAAKGQVTIANGGDIAKEMGWLAGPAILPEAAPGQGGTLPTATPAPTMSPTPGSTPVAGKPWGTEEILVGSGTPSRLYALQERSVELTAERRTDVEHRLLLSDNLGTNWSAFEGGLPFKDSCLRDMTIDPTVQDGLYAITCQGFYRWTNGAWVKVANQGSAVTPGNPQQIWHTTPSSIVRSDDGGLTWVEAAANLYAGSSGNGIPSEKLIVTAGTPPTVYATLSVGRSGTTLMRATPGGTWTTLQPPRTAFLTAFYGMVRHDASGALYLSLTFQKEIWRIPNPTASPEQVIWEKVTSFSSMGKENATLMAAAQGANGVVLFAAFSNTGDSNASTYRSQDSGQTWQIVTFP